MRTVLVSSVSDRISGMATLTALNKMEYCLRHGYSLVFDNRQYSDAIENVRGAIAPLFSQYDVVWVLDADAIITNLSIPIHSLECLGPGVTVCEEGIVPWNKVNCGSMVYRAGKQSEKLLRSLDDSKNEWRCMPCGWQTWIATQPQEMVTIAPLRAFNSCEWNCPGGQHGTPGSHWQPGDFVYHPCGVFPADARMRAIYEKLADVTR